MIDTAMILAAGRGRRMRPLTDVTPKPLLSVCGRPLLEWHLRKLAQAGFRRVVVNGAWLAEQIDAFVQQVDLDLALHFSAEPPGGLETAGGIVQALPLLGDAPFAVINGDVFSDYDYGCFAPPRGLAHLVLVPSPPHNAEGDFGLQGARVTPRGPWTFSGLSVLRPELLAGLEAGSRPLAPLLRQAMAQGAVTGEVFHGLWSDVGTPQRLHALEKTLGCA